LDILRVVRRAVIREQKKDWCADWKKNTQSDFVSLCGVRGWVPYVVVQDL